MPIRHYCTIRCIPINGTRNEQLSVGGPEHSRRGNGSKDALRRIGNPLGLGRPNNSVRVTVAYPANVRRPTLTSPRSIPRRYRSHLSVPSSVSVRLRVVSLVRRLVIRAGPWPRRSNMATNENGVGTGQVMLQRGTLSPMLEAFGGGGRCSY